MWGHQQGVYLLRVGYSEGKSRKMILGGSVDGEQLSLVDHGSRWGQSFPEAEATQSSDQGRSLTGSRFSDLEPGDKKRMPVLPYLA